jgi:hypothetical protein
VAQRCRENSMPFWFQMANFSSAVADLQSEIRRAVVKEVELLQQKE